jgi:hypothetical protein
MSSTPAVMTARRRRRAAVENRMDKLRQRVRSWYLEEATRVAAAAEDAPDLERLDFTELNRRAQVLFACEMAALARADEEDEQPRLVPGSPEYVQLQRVAAAMQAQGKEVPESILQTLHGGQPAAPERGAPRRRAPRRRLADRQKPTRKG